MAHATPYMYKKMSTRKKESLFFHFAIPHSVFLFLSGGQHLFFGDGVTVEAEENPQGMFYTAAAMYNPDLAWVFDGAKDVEIVIVQPPYVRRWVTTFDRLRLFERELVLAVKQAQGPNPPLRTGDHCRWCNAKPICPAMNGAQDRVMALAL